MAARRTLKIAPEKRRTCTKCGFMGHLSTTCEGAEKHHDKIGIEVEGYWLDLATAKKRAMEKLGRGGNADASLPLNANSDPNEQDESDYELCTCGDDDCDDCQEQSRSGTPQSWEFQTPPGTLAEGIRGLIDVYPDMVNRSCGIHVHISFLEASSVTLLASDAFFTYFRAEMSKWGDKAGVKGKVADVGKPKGAFWERLDGGNRYCQINTHAEMSARAESRGLLAPGKKGVQITAQPDRYRQVNFHAWNEHRTVEFRLLPTFQSARLAVGAIETMVTIVEMFLANKLVQIEASAPRPAQLPLGVPTAIEVHTSEVAAVVGPRLSLDRGAHVVDVPTITPPKDGHHLIPATQVRVKLQKMLEALDM